jgi:hypothetical protein
MPPPAHHRTIAPDDVLIVQYRPAWKEQAYLRFARIPHRIENCVYPFAAGDSPSVLTPEDKLISSKTRELLDSIDITTSDLPKIFDRRNIATSTHTISYMSSHLCNLDSDLDTQQMAQVMAFSTLVERTLNVILVQSRWVGWTGKDWSQPDACSKASTNDITDAMKAHRLFPFNYFVSWVERRKAQSMIKQNRMPCATIAQETLYEGYRALETILFNGASGSGSSGDGSSVKDDEDGVGLSGRWNNGPYMFGRSTPCSLDAIVFGHVATAASERISEYGKEIESKFPLLWKHYKTILNTYFSRSMVTNNNNSFYRLSKIAKERIQIKENQKLQELKENDDDDVKSTQKDKEELDDLERVICSVNKRHKGGENHLYLPKASRSKGGRVGLFSGRTTLKPKKTKSDVDKVSRKSEEKKTAAQLEQEKQNKYFLGFCGIAVVGYLFWSGRIAFSDDVDEY